MSASRIVQAVGAALLGVYLLATSDGDRGLLGSTARIMLALGCAALVGLLLIEDDAQRVRTALAVTGAILGFTGVVLGWVTAFA